MLDNSDSDEECSTTTPPEIKEIANSATLSLLPDKSRKIYEITYKRFRDWCADKKTVHLTENVLFAYSSDRSKSVKPSTLWSEYSIVRRT